MFGITHGLGRIKSSAQTATSRIANTAKSIYQSILDTPNKIRTSCQSIKDGALVIKRIMKPFFKREHRAVHIRSGLSITGIQLMQILLFKYFADKINNGDKNDNERSQADEYFDTLFYILFQIITGSLQYASWQYLTSSFDIICREDVIKRYCTNGALVGLENVRLYEESMSTALGVSSDVVKAANTSLKQMVAVHISQLSSGFLNVFINYPLSALAIALDIYFAQQITKNNRVVFVAGGTAVGVTLLSVLVSSKLRTIQTKQTGLSNQVVSRASGLEQGRKEIAALKGEMAEFEKIYDLLNQQRSPLNTLFALNFSHIVLISIAEYGFPIVIKAFAPSLGLLTEKQLMNKALLDLFSMQMADIMQYLKSIIVGLPSTFATLRDVMARVNNFYRQLEEWEKFVARGNQLITSYNHADGMVNVQGFTLAIPQMSRGVAEKRLGFADFVEETIHTNPILKDVNLTLERDGVYRLKGRSGIGKTTVLRALAGLWPFCRGNASFGCAPDEVYFAPQEPYLPNDASLLQALFYPAEVPASYDKSLIEGALNFLGLGKYSKKLTDIFENFDFLSRGERQRLSLIRCLLKTPQPKVFILDEGTASIDQGNKDKVEFLLRIYFKDCTIIYVDHAAKQHSQEQDDIDSDDEAELKGLTAEAEAKEAKTGSDDEQELDTDHGLSLPATDLTYTALAQEDEDESEETELMQTEKHAITIAAPPTFQRTLAQASILNAFREFKRNPQRNNVSSFATGNISFARGNKTLKMNRIG